MSLTDPKFTSASNPGVVRTNQSQTLNVLARSGINQIRGVTVAGATGNGIPKHVTDVGAKVANAQAGVTSSLTVVFRRDPSDAAFSGVNVLVKGYQNNQSPVQVAAATESPVTCILNNTGESLSVIVQATGNGGSAPIDTAPTTGVKLPLSTNGGFGTNTNTSGETFGPEPANTFFAGPTSGADADPTFRAWVPADFPYFMGNGGYILGPGIINPQSSFASQAVAGGNANTVSVFLFVLSHTQTIGHCTVDFSGGTNGKKFSTAIYDISGNRLIDGGVFTLSGGSGLFTNSFTQVTLRPGSYYYAVAQDTAAGVTVFGLGALSSGNWQLMNKLATIVRVGTAANSASGWTTTAMPSTLGAITADTTKALPIVMWEP